VAAEDAGLASGLFNTSQQVGGALGLAILSTLAANVTSSRLADLGHAPGAADRASAIVDGFRVAFLSGMGLMLLGVILILLLVRRRDVAAINGTEAAAPVAV
jgi:hypothetical protein